MEYARSNIKRPRTQSNAEDEPESATLDPDLPARDVSGYSSSGSAKAGGSEDWSVISDVDPSSSDESQPAQPEEVHELAQSSRRPKRTSFASAVRSALTPSTSTHTTTHT